MKRKPALAMVNATVLVVSADGKEGILIKPRKQKKNGGWELPGGKIDEGESLPAGACREVLEETGMEVQLRSMVALYKCARQDSLMFLFLGRCVGGEIRPDGKEVAEARWVPLDSILSEELSDLTRQRIDDCLNFSGSPLYRLIRKRPFQVLESWDLGPSSLDDNVLLEQVRESAPGSESPKRSRSKKRGRWWFRSRRKGSPELAS